MVSDLLSQTFSRFPHFNGRDIHVRPLEKGGSDRSFHRMQIGNDVSLILAKYGQARDENRHYVSIARFLADAGVRVPEIYFHDEAEGLIWMEDLGDQDLWSYRFEPWPKRRELYHNALNEVLILHSRAHEVLPADPPKFQPGFDETLYLWEQNYFFENCLGRHFGISTEEISDRCNREQLSAIAVELAALPRCFVHRDFQSQNIVVKDGRCCLIDFQGMRLGLAPYDLASLLYDPYVHFTSEERRELLDYYLNRAREEQTTHLPKNFERVFSLCATQRLMQALGAYGFLGHVRERTHFLEHIPAALTNLREVIGQAGGLEDLAKVIGDLEKRG